MSELDSIDVDDLLPECDETSLGLSLIYSCLTSSAESASSPFQHTAGQGSQFQVETDIDQLATTQLDNECPQDSQDTSLELRTVSESTTFQSSEVEADTDLIFLSIDQYQHNNQLPNDVAVSDNLSACYPTSENVTLQPTIAEVISTETCFPLLTNQQQLSQSVQDKYQPSTFKPDPEQKTDYQSILDLRYKPDSRAVTDSSSDTGGFNPSNFKKAEDNSLSQLAVARYLPAMESVGALIRYKQLVGTVFRIGSSYVMTAWHCIYAIIYDPFGKTQLEKLKDENVFIHFSPFLTTSSEDEFYVEDLCYRNESLDVAVLKVITKSGRQPSSSRSLKLCKNSVSDTDVPHADIIGFGHPTDKANLKVLEPSCKIISPDDPSVANARRWFQGEKSRLLTSLQQPAGKKPLGYEGIERQEKMLFSCFAEHGISGAPIISIKDPQHIYVIGIVTNGLPHCLWDLNAAHRAHISLDYRFEMGTRMNYIFKDMNERCPELAQEIFS